MKYLKKYNESKSDIIITEDNYLDYFMELIDCGYELNVPQSIFQYIPESGEHITISFKNNDMDRFNVEHSDTISKIEHRFILDRELKDILKALNDIKERLQYTYDDKTIMIRDSFGYKYITFYII